jgi:hypothetical protein
MNTSSPTRSLPWWLIALIVITLPLVIYNYPDIYRDLPEVWKVRYGSFRVIFEMNYPTWWTAILLFAAALLFYESAYTRQSSSRIACLMLTLLVAGLSYDEAGSIHERVSLLSEAWFDSAWTGLLPFALAGVLVLIYGISGIAHTDGGRRAALFIVSGFVMFALVVVQEYLEHHPSFPKFMLKTLGLTNAGSRLLEEVTEMIGAMLVLTGAALFRAGDVFSGHLGFILARPSKITSLKTMLLIGLAAHCVIAFYFLPDAEELTLRGNPAGWYPTAVFFILFAHAYWQFRSVSGTPDGTVAAKENRKLFTALGWLRLSIFFILSSIGFLHNFGHVFMDSLPGLHKPFYFNPLVIYSFVIGSVIVFVLWLGLFSGKRLIYLGLLLCTPLVEIYIPNRGAPLAASAITSYLIARVFLFTNTQASE